MAVFLVAWLLAAPICASQPVPGALAAGFDPGPGYGGHWGVDFDAPPGTPVRAAQAGFVTFAGVVVDNRTVTVSHGGTLRTTYSYLGSIAVAAGDAVAQGDVVATSGRAHGRPGLHVSVRIGDRYVDPMRLLACDSSPHSAVRLVSSHGRWRLYAVRRAARHSGRNLRPLPRGPSHGRGRGAPSARPRRGHLHHRRRSVPEARHPNVHQRPPLEHDGARDR
ncbi:MAG: M23 family metallopeptidase [Acidimicrobiia bacterium]|nr:M23 family metallopeptidase [Acidimicrobiia bacterium]NNF11517.1 M23 family metallopeptidase [Acidimicrobiia bacterium]NNL71053.1 M23 family metallopeptidase [Acidimicrobiia bacterium]